MSNEKDKIEEAIIKTIKFFDMFDFSLTSFEVWKYLGVKTDLLEVENILTGLCASGKIKNDRGFYFLPGREKIIIDRLQRYNYAERKFSRVAWVARVFRFIPWIKMIAVGNLIGSGNLRDGGDIDLFIVAKKDRLWLTRFFCTALMKLSRMRPRPGNERDKICLSFFVSEEALDLQKILLDNDDWYLVYWLACLQVIFDREQIYRKLINDNQWLNDKLPNWFTAERGTRHEVFPLSDIILLKIIDKIFSKLENPLRQWQINHFPAVIKGIMNKDKRVMVDNAIIKLHTNDRREEFMKRFYNNVE